MVSILSPYQPETHLPWHGSLWICGGYGSPGRQSPSITCKISSLLTSLQHLHGCCTSNAEGATAFIWLASRPIGSGNNPWCMTRAGLGHQHVKQPHLNVSALISWSEERHCRTQRPGKWGQQRCLLSSAFNGLHSDPIYVLRDAQRRQASFAHEGVTTSVQSMRRLNDSSTYCSRATCLT